MPSGNLSDDMGANVNLESRPIPDAFRALEEICTAILESRLAVETTIETNGGKFIVKNRIIVDPAS